MLDATRFPLLARYVARLPEGLDSYPDAVSKGSLIRSAVLSLTDPEPGWTAELPGVLAALFEAPPPAGLWVPAVHTEAAFLAILDREYPDAEAAAHWTYVRTVNVSPLYRRLFRVPGPGRFLKMGAQVYRLIQRGATLDVELDGQTARVTERFPPHLHAPATLATNVGVLRGVIEVTGGADAHAEILSIEDGQAIWACSWS